MAGLFTQHTLTLPDGNEIFYTDSGPPDTPDYTTLIAQHGCAFNGATFLPLHKFAHERNVRVLLFTRRGYRGSTPFTEAELKAISHGDKAILERLAIHNAWFMEHFIKNERIPKLCSNRKTGGIILVGWSFGNVTSLSLLSHPGILPRDLYETIEPYLMAVVLYDPPSHTLGYLPPNYDGSYNPLSDPDCKASEERWRNFFHWVSTYFEHPDIHSGKPEGLQYRNQSAKSSTKNWSHEQVERYFESSPAAQCDIPMVFGPMQAHITQQRNIAFFDEKITSSFFPQVLVHHVSCSATIWSCIWAWLMHKQDYDGLVAQGKKVRPHKFTLVEGANHLLHFDLPTKFLDVVLEGVGPVDGGRSKLYI